MKRLASCILAGAMLGAPVSKPALAADAMPDIFDRCVGDATRTGYQSIPYTEFRAADNASQELVVMAWLQGVMTGIGLVDKNCAQQLATCLAGPAGNILTKMMERVAEHFIDRWDEPNTTAYFMFAGIVDPCLRGWVPATEEDIK